jgi:hypothetical protein
VLSRRKAGVSRYRGRSCCRKFLTLSTIADVRDLVNKRLPPSYKSKQVWQRVAVITAAAARGQLPAEEVTVALKMVLAIEGISCR